MLEDLKDFFEDELEQLDLHYLREMIIAQVGIEGAKAIIQKALDKINKELDEID
jgi:hypothetical protein